MQTNGLPIAGEAASIHLYPTINGRTGESLLARDRDGSGWLGVIDLSVYGQRGGFVTAMTLHPKDARLLAAQLTRQADFAEARAKGEAGPCLCSAWSHNMTPCSNDAAMDYSMCRECWSPETGQSTLTMGHGQ